MGVPVDLLLSQMYYNTSRKQAAKEVAEGLEEEEVVKVNDHKS